MTRTPRRTDAEPSVAVHAELHGEADVPHVGGGVESGRGTLGLQTRQQLRPAEVDLQEDLLPLPLDLAVEEAPGGVWVVQPPVFGVRVVE